MQGKFYYAQPGGTGHKQDTSLARSFKLQTPSLNTARNRVKATLAVFNWVNKASEASQELQLSEDEKMTMSLHLEGMHIPL